MYFFFSSIINEHRICFMQFFKWETIAINKSCAFFLKTRGFIAFCESKHRIERGFIVSTLVSFKYGGWCKCARVLVRFLMKCGGTKVHGTGGFHVVKKVSKYFLHLPQWDNPLFSYLIHVAYEVSRNYLISLFPINAKNEKELQTRKLSILIEKILDLSCIQHRCSLKLE